MNVETDNFANHPKKLLNDRKRSLTCNLCNYTSDRPSNLKIKKNIFWFIMVRSLHVAWTRCDYSTSTYSSLESHMMIHSGEKPFSCKQCNYSFTRSSHLNTHMVIHSGKSLIAACNFLDKRFCQHFDCSQCSLSCTTVDNLKDHISTNSGEILFHCD